MPIVFDVPSVTFVIGGKEFTIKEFSLKDRTKYLTMHAAIAERVQEEEKAQITSGLKQSEKLEKVLDKANLGYVDLLKWLLCVDDDFINTQIPLSIREKIFEEVHKLNGFDKLLKKVEALLPGMMENQA